ncbi:PpiC-type peptidyl-prolyl cis-trans isomerase [Gluconacetobacter diazotrophicus PA1 5]|nr:peptidylprolyl isomerase [Gluconacetobacter diazotrophicus]ACI52773.1 PpiC-type peptidyl-prolyl cis-trans isomerase [Gluconacetobacter diazotrophicus PA1 5]TWB06102.1 periplasmic chaperone for outer membrane proteins SurA [Gluconacetobacter diazotrophicus]
MRRRPTKTGFSSNVMACLLAAGLAAVAGGPALAARHAPPPASAHSSDQSDATSQDAIIAIIDGTLLTRRDVDNRGRLFALSAGLTLSDDVMARLRPQILRQLIDERLRQNEMLSRHINVSPDQIAASIADIERRNGMPKNALRDRLAQDGISLTTMIDQIRVQLGWSQVLREEMGTRGRITAAEISQREEALRHEDGKPQYLISEIFIPVDDPRHSEDELKFTQTIIQELRNGAPFPIVAAQFSQNQAALEGGLMGWVQEDSLDPQVVEIAKAMPPGAISNPIRVAGGYVIATLNGRRVIGHQMGTLVSLREAFIPFTTPLDPQAPSEQQRDALKQAQQISTTVHSCPELEAINHKFGDKHPSNPGDVQLERVNEQMQKVLTGLTPGQASHPLVAPDGIAVLMVCSRQQKNFAQQTPSDIADQLMNERAEQTSRQLDRDLHRRAIIEMRSKV